MNNQHIPHKTSRAGKIGAGLILITVGTVLLLKQMGYFFPHWMLTWPVLLIILGLFIGFKSNFRKPFWIILVIIGGIFLARNFYPDFEAHRFVWPVLIILFGLIMIFKKQRYSWAECSKYPDNNLNLPIPPTPVAPPVNPEPFTSSKPIHGTVSSDDYLDITSVLGGVKKIVVSKNFRGGEIVTFMGGTEINLTQSDIQGRAVLDVTQAFGGTRLIVPAHWHVISEMTAVFAGIEDKRILNAEAIQTDKTLIIKGTSVMGGIDIRSY